MKTINLFFADDHEIVLRGLFEIFDEYNKQHAKERGIKLRVAGYAKKPDELRESITRTDIDVFITDLGFESTRGDIGIIKLMLEKNPAARMVVFSMRSNINTIAGCYRSGVKGYVTKANGVDALIDAIIDVAEGKDYFAPGVLDQIGLMSIRDPLAQLDEREVQIFTRLAEGVEIEDLAHDLGISEKTITNLISTKIKPVIGVSKKGFREAALKMGIIDDLG